MGTTMAWRRVPEARQGPARGRQINPSLAPRRGGSARASCSQCAGRMLGEWLVVVGPPLLSFRLGLVSLW